jgi:hypothetical protein
MVNQQNFNQDVVEKTRLEDLSLIPFRHFVHASQQIEIHV